MRKPDDDGGLDQSDSPLGDGFGASADDLNDGFGEDDFSDDAHESVGEDSDDDERDEDGEGAQFGDGLSDEEAENVLVEILDDVFGEDAPQVVRELEASTGLDPSELVDVLSEPSAVYGANQDPLSPDFAVLNGLETPDEGFDDTDLPTKDDFDLTHDGQVDHHDLNEVTHPFDFHAG